jgi:uncharacterized protein
MNPVEHDVVDVFKKLLNKKLKVAELILFGSRARGDADPDSDLDVLVIADELSPELEEYISECAWEAGFQYGIVIVPVVFTRNEWENGPERYSLLAEAIKSEGVIL